MSQRDFARRLKSGYTDFKGITIPGVAAAFVLTDSDTGTKYLVSFNTDGLGVQRVTINTVYRIIEIKEGVRTYGPEDGPYMGENAEYRLFIRGGRLGFIYDPLPFNIYDIEQAPPHARTETTQRRLSWSNTDKVRLGMQDG